MSEESFNLNYQISPSKIQEICNATPSSPNVSLITPMSAGLSAYMVKLDFTNSPSWMLRIINPEEEKAYEQEMGALLHVKQNYDIPIPNIIFQDNTGKFVPEPYYIYEYLPGDTLGHQLESLNFSQKEQIFADLGEYLAKMHLDQKSKSCMILFKNDQLVFEPFERKTTMEEYMYLGQSEDFEWAIQHAFKENYSDLYPGCEKIWNKYKNSLRDSVSPIGYCHNDLLADNLIIHKGKIAAIIDWEMGCYNDSLYDLARTERGILRRIVFLTDDEREKLRERFLSSYRNFHSIESSYWEKRVAHHIVQAMDDLGQIPEYRERFPKEYCDRVEQNLIKEIEEYIEYYH